MWSIVTIAGFSLAGAAFPAGRAVAQTFTVLTTLSNAPAIGAVSGPTLYGTTAAGGSAKDGTLFSLTNAGKNYTVLHSFSGTSDGASPDAMLAIDSSGNIFGIDADGGAYSGGTLWEYNASKVFSLLHAFGSGMDGADPLQGPSVYGSDVIYGSTAMGAVKTNGNVFKMSAGKYTAVYDFLSGKDGHCPFSGVVVGKNGYVYGTTVGYGFGGNPNGSVWELSQSGVLTTLYAFTDGSDGEWPMQTPVFDSAGNVYGTTAYYKGKNFAGAFWEVDTGGKFHLLHDFNEATEGGVPNSPLMLNKDGYFYGTTSTGGAGGYGTVYRITTAGAVTVMHAFADKADGAQPTGNLVHDTVGNIYGGTSTGQVFKIVP